MYDIAFETLDMEAAKLGSKNVEQTEQMDGIIRPVSEARRHFGLALFAW